MSTRIPLPIERGQAILNGMTAGGNLFKLLTQPKNNLLHPSGDVANALYVEQMKAQYGENDPRYLNAKAAHDMAMAGHQSLQDYRINQSNLAPFRATSNLGKLNAEGRGEGALDLYGNKPTSTNNSQVNTRNTTPSPEQGDFSTADEQGSTILPGNEVNQQNSNDIQNQKAIAYERAMGKLTGDPDARKKMLFAQNLEKTIDNLNIDDLVQYSGPKGQFNQAKDFIQGALSGKTSENFIKNREAVAAAKLLSKQVRQFYGTSIQPQATAELDRLTNPATWSKNPDLAKAELQQFLKILGQESETYRNAGESPIKLQKKRPLDFKNGQFQITVKGETLPEIGGQNFAHLKSEEENPQQQMDFANAMSRQLIDVIPQATAENIIETAKLSKKSVKEVVEDLVNHKKRIMANQGGQ